MGLGEYLWIDQGFGGKTGTRVEQACGLSARHGSILLMTLGYRGSILGGGQGGSPYESRRTGKPKERVAGMVRGMPSQSREKGEGSEYSNILSPLEARHGWAVD